jgi:hypothetical protein
MLWLIAQILLGHTDGGLNFGWLLTRKWARSTRQCSNLQYLPPRTQSGKEQHWTTSIQHVSSPQSPITMCDALSPHPLAPTQICPPCRGAKPYELEVQPVEGQVAEWHLNKE